MIYMKKISVLFLVLLFSLSSFSATKNQSYNYQNYESDYVDCSEIKDPYEKINRKIFAFNSFLDYVFLRPVSKSYKILVPDGVKDKVGNFLENLTVPVTVVNNTLQLNTRETVAGIWRFFINTTVGIGGIFDVASKMGIKVQAQTFGSTLARYGVGSGPYIVVPFFGASNGRDITDIFVMGKIDPVRYNMNPYQRRGQTALSMIHKRAEILEITDQIASESPDPYASIRSLTHQKRENTLRYPDYMKDKCKLY